MICEFCNNEFSNKQNLNSHQRKTSYCLKIQGKTDIGSHTCEHCDSSFTKKYNYNRHVKTCKKTQTSTELAELTNQLINCNNLIVELRVDKKDLQERYDNLSKLVISHGIEYKEDCKLRLLPDEDEFKKLQTENKNNKNKIQHLTKKYVKSQPRVQYTERNVIYILTTRLMKKERRYILGKATNLTSRLSTYNKSDEHEVVYYQECNDAETMSCVENMVFKFLSAYREQANRERFILPEDEEIELFSNTIKKSVEFFNE